MDNIKTQMTQLTELVKDMYMNQCAERACDANTTIPKHCRFFNTAPELHNCFKCNGTGHVNWNSSGNISSPNVCQLCSHNGHVAIQCNVYTSYDEQ